MGDGLSIQQVITGVLVPVVTAGFWILWNRGNEAAASSKASQTALWAGLNASRAELADHKVECERHFARADDMKHLEARIDQRFDRLEEKLDRAIGRQEA